MSLGGMSFHSSSALPSDRVRLKRLSGRLKESWICEMKCYSREKE